MPHLQLQPQYQPGSSSLRSSSLRARSIHFCFGLLFGSVFSVPTLAAQEAANNKAFRAMVDRQVQAWEKHDFALGAGDWAHDGELTSPGGHATLDQMQPTITDYFQHFRDLKVTVKRTFLSADGSEGAIEWDWDITRIRDGKEGLTHDAILVTLEGGKIKSWREYFNLAASVDANP